MERLRTELGLREELGGARPRGVRRAVVPAPHIERYLDAIAEARERKGGVVRRGGAGVNRALVLTYHAIGDGDGPLFVDPATFAAHLDLIAESRGAPP